jgi:hypothetical protein
MPGDEGIEGRLGSGTTGEPGVAGLGNPGTFWFGAGNTGFAGLTGFSGVEGS